jgi:hypothetical protein
MSANLDRIIYTIRQMKQSNSLDKPIEYPQEPEQGGPAGAPGATPPMPGGGSLNKEAMTNMNNRLQQPSISTVPEKPQGPITAKMGGLLSHMRAKRTMPQSPTS